MAWAGGSSSVFSSALNAAVREHMHFVDDVDFEAALIGREIDLVAQIANVIHAGIGGGIDFDQIEETAVIDRLADSAFVARPFRQIFMQTVDRFGQQARRCRLARAARAAKQVGMPNAPGSNAVLQGSRDMLLPNNFIKAGRTPFAV